MSITRILTICMLIVLVIPLASALPVVYESGSVGRIVGSSPGDMKKQLEMDFDLEHSAYYNLKGERDNKKEWLLDKLFDYNNVISQDKDWENDIINFDENELIIIESPYWDFNIGNFLDDSSVLQKKPLAILDYDYAGFYRPDISSSFPLESLSDSTLIAPTSVSSQHFVKSMICNLALYDSLGEAFRMARNRYYWGTSAEEHEMIGLVLMSYSLYGSPLSGISVPYDEEAFQNDPLNYMYAPYSPYEDLRQFLSDNYCGPYLAKFDEEEDAEVVSTSLHKASYNTLGTLENIYTQEITFNTLGYEIIQQNNFSLITTNHTNLKREYDELVLPVTVLPMELPLRTVVTNITLLSLENPVDITIPDLPMWQDELVNRTCYKDLQPAGISYSHTFSEKNAIILTTINPVEVLDCESGHLRLYRTVKYKIDYLPFSPVLLDSVNYPDELVPGHHGTINVRLKNIRTEQGIGQIVLMDDNEVIAEEEVSMDGGTTQTLDISFTAPEQEGLRTYTIGFRHEDEIKTETDFRISIDSMDTTLLIPSRILSSTTAYLVLRNKRNHPVDIQINHYLKKDNKIIDSGDSSRTLIQGINHVDVTYSGLTKEDQSYTLEIDLLYGNTKEVVSGSIVTNHKPVLSFIPDIIINEGEPAIINPEAVDYDQDYLTYEISDPVGDDGIWYTDYDSAGNYTVTVTVTDGYLTDSQDVDVEVKDKHDSRKVIFRDCNYGAYRGGFVEIALDFDYDNYLESWYSSNQFQELGQHFGYITTESWPLGICLYDSSAICVEDSDISDPDWYNGEDDFPDPKFELGGTCDTSSLPNALYEGHEVCEGDIECEYPFCSFDYECGTNDWVGDFYCMNNSVHHDYRIYSCLDAASYYSNCTQRDEPMLLANCSSSQECYEGACVDITCIESWECGTDGYLGLYCGEKGIYNDYRTWTCENSGSALSECTYSDRTDYISSCTNDQICVYGECLNKSFYIQGTFTDGDEEKDLKYNVAGNKTFHISLPKHSEIRNATIKVEGGR